MNVTNQEQVVIIGTFISMLGQDFVNEHIDKKKVEHAILMCNEIEDNTTPKQRRESMIRLLDTTMDEFLKA
ncbi:hypothetical protein [Bacillus toyonensis]|uniref:Phage protein n=1 Tax=Bacillus toyonensis TaxID=155322 RepID=A0A2A8H6X3_9BACI|nr:hypothetical protein [Bacillus toyonensis]PEP89765.1 hypothetical protein CN585_28445 [Bacillus toyonensis]